MKRQIAALLLACTLLCSASNAKIKVLTIGDSTMANYDEVKNSGEDEMRGWGQMLPLFFNQDVTVENAAKNGRSSKSFYYEFWEKLRETLKPGDYVVIQFGHNDEKNNGQDSAPDDRSARGTAPWGQYQEYLSRYVKESRERGAVPLLATPIVRRMFDADGKGLVAQGKHNLGELLRSENDTLYDYVLAMKDIAKKLNVPLVDMTALTEKATTSLGPEKAKEIIYCAKDNTHLKGAGALIYANLFVDDIKRQGILSQYLSYPDGIVAIPAKLDFGTMFLQESTIKALSVVGMNLPSTENIKMQVSPPYFVSLSPDKNFSDKVEFPASQGGFYKSIYVKFEPSKTGNFSKTFLLKIEKKKKEIALSGDGLAANKSKRFSSEYSSNYGIYPSRYAEMNSRLEGLIYIVDIAESVLTTPTRIWPKDEIDMNAARYIEVSIKAKKDLYISEIAYRLAGVSSDKMQFSAFGSADSKFENPDTYSSMETIPPRSKLYEQKVALKLAKGKTYYFRIYPWDKNGGGEKYLKLESLSFRGFELK